MAVIASFRDLIAWQKSIDLAESCYRLAKQLPIDERYELGSQLRRAGISVPSNVAEGHRMTSAGFRHHLRHALGSEAEIETDLVLAGRLHLLPESETADAIALAQEVARIIHRLHASIR